MSALTGFRISPQQARAWRDIQQQVLVNAANWLVIEPLRAPSPVEIEARLQELGEREEILRTALHALPGMAVPIQVIEDVASVTFVVEDWRGLCAQEREAHLAQLREGRLDEPVLSVCYARTTDDHWTLWLKGSAALLDQTSLALIAAELLGAPTHERLQYVDYAEWKNSLLEEEAEGQAVRFWQQARTESAPLELHGLQTSAASALYQPALQPLHNVPTRRELQHAAEQADMSLEEWLFSAWCVLLARLSGQQRIQLGWCDAGRGEGLEQALGLFEQVLPIQAEVDLHASLQAQASTLLGQLRQARGWRDYYDSEQVCEVFFACRDAALLLSHGELIDAGSLRQRFALGLECRLDTATLELRLAYDRTRFDATAIACIEEQWTLLLRGLCAPAQPIGTLSLVGPHQDELLQNSAAQAQVRAIGVLGLIEERAKATPNAPALADAGGITHYGELLVQIESLARRLCAEGVQASDVVGILLRRERQAIVAMLAALRAGAAYLPLDPSYPAERLAYMIENSGARLLLSTTDQQGSGTNSARTLLLDVASGEGPETISLPIVALQQTAYLIYTSGSSGQPKGVPISHASLSHSTQVRMAYYREPVQSYLLLSSLSFDSSVAGIYWTLCQGGLLVLPASGEELDLETLAGLIERHRISHSLSLPSLYETLLDYCAAPTLAHLRNWIVAGEPCTARVLDKHRSKAPQAQLVNEYGPTEATVWATAQVLSDAALGDAAISIGKPIPGMQLWLLNDSAQQAAIGEPGEIHLGGPTLASGYLGLPEQTASAFVRYPHIGDGQRLYRTGDLARRRADGQLDFLGRRDQQIKIRGHRVERGEIERVLLGHSEVRDVVVVAQQLESGARLIAYFTNRHGYAPEPQALSSFLLDRLPSYMVPAAFVPLAALPHTPNGKLDLNALPDPDLLVATNTAYVAPRNDLEAALVEICQQVLKRERIGVQDNFFQIGGDSILSLQIVSRANQQGIKLSAKQMFESETIERMAQVATRCALDNDQAPAAAPTTANASRTASDFPLAALDDEAFDDLLAELNATH
ncbi:MAG: amino acid adenylation domain-containing protein [Pseudomonas sp.]|uniref:non-ribosomal peptide synthetase n=1 Tax=Pseudomonas sp. TaxID=306 RepID=UPI0039826512